MATRAASRLEEQMAALLEKMDKAKRTAGRLSQAADRARGRAGSEAGGDRRTCVGRGGRPEFSESCC